MAITKNLVTDYGADNTGSSSITTILYSNLKTDMQGQDVNLTFPAGSYNIATFGGDGGSWINGALDLNVTATGATLFGSGGVFLSTSHLAQVGIDHASGKSARIQTVSAGATSVTLTAASASAGHISRFSVGQWIMVCGWPIQAIFQGAYGFPPNFQWHDFVKITDITGSTITIDRPLTSYYSSAWPEMNRGSAFEVDSAGPATIFALNANWAGNTTFTGGTYTNSNLINCYRENFTMNGGTSSSLPIYPSVTRSWTAINHTATAALVEHDKLCDLVTVRGGEYTQWHTQSSSTKLLQIDGASIGSLNGTPRNTTVDNATITNDINIGPLAYGRGETFICRNTVVGGEIDGGLHERGPRDEGVTGYFLMSGGVITVPMSVGDYGTRTLVPDATGRNVLFWHGAHGTVAPFRVLSVTSDTWPAADIQTQTVNVTMTSGTKALQVSSPIFSAADVGKVLIVPGVQSGGVNMKTFITAYTDAQNVTVFDPLSGSTLAASSKQIQWGTCNMYVRTDQSGGIPSLGGTVYVPPAMSCRFESCTGTDQAVDLSQAAAQNRPLHSYTKRQYTGNLPTASSSGFRLSAAGALAGQGSKVQMWGYIQSIKFNVTRAYTGAQGTLTAGLGQFFTWLNINDTWTQYNPRINMKVLGERVITVGSVTGTQSGDSNLSLGSSPAWISDGFDPVLSANISGESSSVWPEFTIEMITNQGFPTLVAPLRLGTRA